MAQVVNVNFRMDADLKQSMEKVCSELGMTMTTAFTIFAKKVSRENCPRWNNAAVMGGESLGRLSLLAGARQESAETHQHADSRKA